MATTRTSTNHFSIARIIVLAFLALSLYPFSLPSTAAAQAEMPISAGLPATASSSAANAGPEKANDSTGGTYWLAATTDLPQWWQVDLGQTYSLSFVYFSIPYLGGTCYHAFDGYVETSINGQDWTTLLTFTELHPQLSSDVSGVGRFVRITFTGQHPICAPGITPVPAQVPAALTEFQVYGQESAFTLSLTDSQDQPISALQLDDGWPTRNASGGALANPIKVRATVQNFSSHLEEYRGSCALLVILVSGVLRR